ncbi:hypothetical protein [Nitrosomonas sp.]|nr:hypothetical protein [Nitrosomonas sp.]
MTHYETGGKKIHDANIIATMLAYGIQVILPITPIILNALAISS